MRRWKNSLLLLVLTAACLAQSASQLQTDSIRRVGSKLACLCGACKNTVADCPMLECHFGKPASAKVSPSDSEALARYRERIEKDLAKLD